MENIAENDRKEGIGTRQGFGELKIIIEKCQPSPRHWSQSINRAPQKIKSRTTHMIKHKNAK